MTEHKEPRWRVFVSHTAELRQYPALGQSYIDAVERAIISAGHVPVDMIDFAAAEQPPAQVCIDKVKSCDVYIGILSTRYGSLVRDNPELSYTELEDNTAENTGIPRFMFVVDTTSPNLGIPPEALIDLQHGARQQDFRARISGTAPRFRDPAHLKSLVLQTLQEEATSKRIATGLRDVRQPSAKLPVRAAKFINQPPVMAPSWFQDRVVETGLIADWLADPGIRMITVLGRGGIGKTAMVCRLLTGLEAGGIRDVAGDTATMDVGGIIYLSPTGNHRVTYPDLINDLCKLLPEATAQVIQAHYQDPHNSPEHMMLALLEVLPAHDGPIIVLLDNLESVMDTIHERLAEGALHEALETVLRAPAHPLKILATTHVPPTALLRAGPDSHLPLRLDKGLGLADARKVLRAIDPDGALGLRDASDEVLDTLQERTRGFPRALVAVKSILFNNPELTPSDLLDRTRDLPENDIVEALVGQAYRSLDAPAQQVMQALAVYPSPVAAVAVDFLLQPYDPTVNATLILARLVKSQLVRHDARQYSLHPVDRDYVRAQIPRTAPDGADRAYTLTALQTRTADYYAQIRTPRNTWQSLDDLRPQLAEFGLRCDIGDYRTAAAVLADIDFDYLQPWGHYHTLVELHRRIHGHLPESVQQMIHLRNLGNCHAALGNYTHAIKLYDQALVIAREINDRGGEARNLGNLGNCHAALGNYTHAINLYDQALVIAREINDRGSEARHLGNFGNCHAALGNYNHAMDLHTQALAIAREIDDRQSEARHLGNLGNCHAALGNVPEARSLYDQALTIARAIEYRVGEAINQGNLGHCHAALGNYTHAMDLHTQALTIARTIGNRQREAINLSNLGHCHAALGYYTHAMDLHTQALTINRDIGNRYQEAEALIATAHIHLHLDESSHAALLLEDAVRIADIINNAKATVLARSGLARVRVALGEYDATILMAARARQFNYPIEHPRLWMLEGIALLALGQADRAYQGFLEAVNGTDALLARTPRYVNAMLPRVLACCGLALTGDPARVGEAVQALARLREATGNAAGVLADVDALFTVLTDHDPDGILTPVRAALTQEAQP